MTKHSFKNSLAKTLNTGCQIFTKTPFYTFASKQETKENFFKLKPFLFFIVFTKSFA